jgi:predicted transcriptional regulator of viral defense system
MTKRSKMEDLVVLVRQSGIVRPQDLSGGRIPRTYLRRLVERGVLERTARGLYRLADQEVSENHSVAEASKRVPHGVVCLLSALRFHGLTTQAPFEVWMAIDVKARAPTAGHPPLRIVRMSGAARTAGIEERRVEGVPVRVYSAAKTVADCFKFRNKIGLDVALEALRDYRRVRGSVDDLWSFARTCRVANVIRPYLEAGG